MKKLCKSILSFFNDDDASDLTPEQEIQRLRKELRDLQLQKMIADDIILGIVDDETINLPVFTSIDIAGYLHDNGL